MSKTDEVANVIVKEVPLSQIASILVPPGSSSMGTGCGGGCGGGAGCLDQFGHTGLSDADIKSSLGNSAALKVALKKAISTKISTL